MPPVSDPGVMLRKEGEETLFVVRVGDFEVSNDFKQFEEEEMEMEMDMDMEEKRDEKKEYAE